MRALAHPVRLALLEALLLHGSLTATEAGEAIGESPTTCSFHLRQLAKYGFVEEAGRGSGRQRPWRLVHIGLSFSDVDDSSETGVAGAALSHLMRGRYLARMQAAFEARAAYPREWQEATGISESIMYVTPQELKVVHDQLLDVLLSYRERLADPSQRPASARPVELLLFTYPISLTPDER
jgi:DNA-binding transcriptional ArsR family regulator